MLEQATRTAIHRLARHGRLRTSLPAAPERRRIRREAGISASELAHVLGVSRTVLYDWEAGRRSPSAGFRERYAEALQLLRDSPRSGDGS